MQKKRGLTKQLKWVETYRENKMTGIEPDTIYD